MSEWLFLREAQAFDEAYQAWERQHDYLTCPGDDCRGCRQGDENANGRARE